MRKLLVSLLAALALLVSAAPASHAVKYGTPDGDGHPYVGIMVAKDADGNPMWRCSGTLISPTLYVTAGHCTDGAATAELWFASTLEPNPEAHGYPTTGEVSGTAYTYPKFDDKAFYLNDLGVVVLDERVVLDEYAVLVDAGALDSLKPGPRSKFTAVGYGLQRAFPDAASWKDQALKTRLVANPQLISIGGKYGDFAMLLTNNAKTGGTCFGDSGGGIFKFGTNVLVGVTSFGVNSTCSGTGGVFRLDDQARIAWINSFR